MHQQTAHRKQHIANSTSQAAPREDRYLTSVEVAAPAQRCPKSAWPVLVLPRAAADKYIELGF